MLASAPSTHPLDRPIWSALTTRQKDLAEGGARARRFPPAIGPFADVADMSPHSFAELAAIMSGSEISVLFTPEAVAAPDGLACEPTNWGRFSEYASTASLLR